MAEEEKVLLTEAAKNLIGQTTGVVEMYGVVDGETVRRLIHAIPDQDPRYWDEELANPRYGGTTAPPLMLSYAANRKPPWEEDQISQIMNDNWLDDSGGGMSRKEEALPSLRDAAPVVSHLHAGDEFEIFQYPKLGDKIFYQSKWVDIQEKTGRRGKFLLITTETRYWNQDDETICITRAVGIES